MKGVICFTVITFILSIVLSLLNMILNKSNTKVNKILKLLPGYNCGACGYGSCIGMANEILKDSAAINKCKVCKNKDEILKSKQNNE